MNKQNIERLWNTLKELLKLKFNNSSIYDNCILPTKVIKIVDDKIYILVPSIFAKSILSNDCKDFINEYFETHLNSKLNCIFLLQEEKQIMNIDTNIASPTKHNFDHNNGLIKDYTLDNFIVGDFNKSAYNAICAISRNLGSTYNPLFIYGSTGLGKTHLITALGNRYFKDYPSKKIKYIDSNEFTRDVFMALSKGSNNIEELKREYISYDLLLIDDIQYLAGKEKTNEIFFNIFNNLVKNNKQIVITADKNPDQLDSLEERMVSRFSSGLTLKIESPEADTLKRIISARIKQNDSNFVFQDDAIDEIVKYYNKDLRKLIGILNKITFYAIQTLNADEIITKEFILRFLGDTGITMLSDMEFNPSLIISTVCKWYGVKEDMVKGKSRLRNLTTVRHVCMYILRNKYNMSLVDIGSHFSNRDHTTVMNAISNVEKLINSDESLKNYINESIKKI